MSIGSALGYAMVVSITHWRPLDLLTRNKKKTLYHLRESYSIFILLHEVWGTNMTIKNQIQISLQEHRNTLIQLDIDFISWLFLLFLDTVVHRIEQVHSPGLSRFTGHLGLKIRCSNPFPKMKNPQINIQASCSALQAYLHLGLSKRSLMEQQPCRSLKDS